MRLGEELAKDMIALRIGPDFRQVLVGAPSYFARQRQPGHAPRPNHPRVHQFAAAYLREAYVVVAVR